MQLNETTFRKDFLFPNRQDTGYFRGYGAPKPHLPPDRDLRAIRAILVHTTNNPRGNTDYRQEAAFLQSSPDVSIAYVVSSHDDAVAQVLPDYLIAWHSGDCKDNDYENTWSIGIEIAWTTNKGPLPQIAINNVTELVKYLLQKYPWIRKIDTHRVQAVPPGRKQDPTGWSDAAFAAWRMPILKPITTTIVGITRWRVKAGDLAPVYTGPSDATGTAKIGTDPVRLAPGTVIGVDATSKGWLHIVEPAPWGWTPAERYESAASPVAGVLSDDAVLADSVLGDTQPGRALVTADSHIISAPTLTLDECGRALLALPHGEYNDHDILKVILPAYWRICEPVGIDPGKAVAQMIHETGNLCSALSQRYDKDGNNLRNSSGIGVWEPKDKATKQRRPGTIYDADVKGYRYSCQFASWDESIKAQIGRLVAYATTPEQRTAAQQQLVVEAMRYRDLPPKCHGSAPTLRLLGTAPNTVDGCGWASPGDNYGDRLAAKINQIRGLA